MSPDELRELWHSEESLTFAKKGEEMLTLVIEKTRIFDRRIAVRNAIECCAAVFVTGLFSWFAWKAPGLVERIGMAIVAASGVWIAFYLLRFGSGPKPLDPGVSLNSYQGLLKESYDQQIRLLRNVKYWYLLPMYLGLMIANVGLWLRLRESGTPTWAAIITIGLVTAVFALVWIANEFYGVRYLQRLKRDLLAATEDKEL